MMRSLTVALFLLATACATERGTPARYDFDSAGALPESAVQLDATIAIPEVAAPSWLRSNALLYRLEYATPSRPQAYALSEWVAPPTELLTLRLRELVGKANSSFTVSRLGSDREAYQLDVTLEQFVQVFSTPRESHCVVTLRATLIGRGTQFLAQRSFHAEQSAPTGDAAGAVYGLVQASNADLEQILVWLRAALGSADVRKDLTPP